mgnify:FL=1
MSEKKIVFMRVGVTLYGETKPYFLAIHCPSMRKATKRSHSLTMAVYIDIETVVEDIMRVYGKCSVVFLNNNGEEKYPGVDLYTGESEAGRNYFWRMIQAYTQIEAHQGREYVSRIAKKGWWTNGEED